MVAELTITLPDFGIFWLPIIGGSLAILAFSKDIIYGVQMTIKIACAVIAALPKGGRYTIAYLGCLLATTGLAVYVHQCIWSETSNIRPDCRGGLSVVLWIFYGIAALASFLTHSSWCEMREVR